MQNSMAGHAMEHAMELLANEVSTAMPSMTLRVSNAVAYVALIFVNVGSAFGLFGPTNAEISARHPTPLTPAGWAFSIWGIIFGLQGVGVIYQLLPKGYTQEGKKRIVNSVGFGWQIGWYFEIAWQLAFVQDTPEAMWVSAVLLLGAFLGFSITLLSLYRLKDTCGSLSSVLLYIAFFLPTTINTAWVSVATGVGVLILPEQYKWDERTIEGLAVVLIVLVTAMGALAMQMEKDTAYGLTLVWALVAVYGAQSSSAVRITALVCIGLNTLLAMFSLLRRKSAGERSSGDVRQPFKSKSDEDALHARQQHV